MQSLAEPCFARIQLIAPQERIPLLVPAGVSCVLGSKCKGYPVREPGTPTLERRLNRLGVQVTRSEDAYASHHLKDSLAGGLFHGSLRDRYDTSGLINKSRCIVPYPQRTCQEKTADLLWILTLPNQRR
jgi:hypothetical protein